MSDITNSSPLNGRLQAMLLARSIEIWTTDDATSGRSYTEQSPRPGLPVPGRASHARIYPGGTPTGTANLEVRCQHGGLPGQVDHGASIAVRRNGEPLYLGSRPPSIITGWEPVWYSAASNYTEPSIAAAPDGSVVVVARKGLELFAKVRAADGTIGAEVTVHADDGREVYWPAVGAIGSELYVVAWRRGLDNDAATPRYALAVWRSTDTGASWELVQDYASDDQDVSAPANTPVSGSYSAGRIRWAYRDGEVVVFAHLTRLTALCDYIRQWAGAGLLTRLDIIETSQAAGGSSAGWASPDVIATPTGFLVAGRGPVPTTGGGGSTWARPIGSAWQPMSTSPATDAFPTNGADGTTTLGGGELLFKTPRLGLCLTWDPVGIAWFHVTENDGTVGGEGAGWCAYSHDGGKTWRRGNSTTNAYADSGAWWMSYDHGASSVQGNCPREMDTVWHRGRILMAHTWEAAIAPLDNSVAIAHLGCWTDLPTPWESDGIRLGHVAGWRRTWLPFEKPDNQDFTTTTSGASAATLPVNDGELQISTGDGAGANGTHYYQHVGTAYSGPMEAGAEWEMRITSGTGSVATTDMGLRLRLATSNHGVEIEINLAGTQVGVKDTVSGGHLIGSPFSGLTSGTRYRFALGLYMDGDDGSGRNATLYYREADQADAQRWTLLGSWVLADDLGAGGTAPHIEFGNIVSAGAGTIQSSRWRMVQWAIPYGSGAAARWGTAADWYNMDRTTDHPSLLAGRPLGTEADYAMDGFTLAGRRGPALIGDTWSIPVTGDYSIDRAISLDVPSPRIHHRSVDVSSDVVIPWAADPDRPDAENTLHPAMVALRIWCNWRLATLEYRTAGGVWATSATIDTRVLQGASYTRNGIYLRASSTGNTTYLTRDEVDGDWTAEWDDGAGTTVYRHLTGNSPGRWSSATTEPRARLQLTETKAGDPTTGGTLSLWSPEVVVLVPATTASAWRLVIDSTHGTADGDYRTKLAWCDAHILAQPPSWGRGFTAIPGHERVELEGGLGVRVNRAPAARELRIAWDDGVDETDIGQSSAVRYARPFTGGEPGGAVAAVPRGLAQALVRQAGRPVGWVVWDQNTGPIVLRRRHEQLWGTAPNAPDIEIVLGDEGSTEVVRVATTTIREER